MASLGTGYPLGYPDIRQVWAEKRPSAAESAPAGGYPLALAGIRQGIADIRGGLSPPISSMSTVKSLFCASNPSSMFIWGLGIPDIQCLATCANLHLYCFGQL
ncbi:hypothetical protein PGT21_021681 [Puccinia graminis f. sp. tritici]|uniref:Uncharacterized protein n=1 Tax=Puccinia graminis f. sp. tritici TaxID=56615 RepID=A0A5B0NUG0_PUCGR|nr:hypothetical protein PGT21_021681 [Puccinia graminis f. sp. tritici]KAA1092392.1 hypothetical protein PGTUg99_025661 [Puccinia graminis f. sp. tritici]